MNRLVQVFATTAGAMACALVVTAIVLHQGNAARRADINQREVFVQQSVQLEALYREIVRALAELGARSDDGQVREMLARHGITYQVNPTAAPPTPAAPTAAPGAARKG